MARITSLADLANNITGAVESISSLVTGKTGIPKYPRNPAVASILSNSELQGNWMKLSFPYTFSVLNINTGRSSPDFGDFELPLAPQAIKQSEEFAISIRPTQGGTTTSHSGNRYKSLNIKGTTGIAPFRGAGGVNIKTGEGILQPKELKFKSGYEVFINLRNWFRAYYEYKASSGTTAKDLRLVFKNYKDGEFLIVELEKFDMDRQAQRSFLYDYDLQFKVLSHFQFSAGKGNWLSAIEDSVTEANVALDTARGIFLKAQDTLRQLESTYEAVVVEPLRKIGLAVRDMKGVPSVAADMGSKAITETVSASGTKSILSAVGDIQKKGKNSGALSPTMATLKLPKDIAGAAKKDGAKAVLDLGPALMDLDPGLFPEATRAAMQADRNASRSLPRSFYEETLNNLIRVKQNAEDFFNMGDAQYDALFNRTATLSATFAKVPTPEELEVLHGFNQSIAAIQALLATEDLFKSTYDDRIQDMIDRFGGNLELVAETSVKQITYESGMTLERLAQIELGDSTRWAEIAEVNDLKAPYVTDDLTSTQTNVIKPGDTILIPIGARGSVSQVPAVKEIKTTRGLSEVEKSLGTDLKLTKDFDLSISNAGDLEVISGSDNMGQAILLKLSYEQGEVIRHPGLGVGLLVGTKAQSLEAIRDNVVTTLMQDSRVENVEDLSIRREGSAIYLTFNIRLKQIDIPIPLKIQI